MGRRKREGEREGMGLVVATRAVVWQRSER